MTACPWCSAFPNPGNGIYALAQACLAIDFMVRKLVTRELRIVILLLTYLIVLAYNIYFYFSIIIIWSYKNYLS
jgi:hypothetical protein